MECSSTLRRDAKGGKLALVAGPALPRVRARRQDNESLARACSSVGYLAIYSFNYLYTFSLLLHRTLCLIGLPVQHLLDRESRVSTPHIRSAAPCPNHQLVQDRTFKLPKSSADLLMQSWMEELVS